MGLHNLDNAENVKNTQTKIINHAKNKIFDLIAILLIFALIAVSLNVLEKRDIDATTFINILFDAGPFYFLALLLTTNYYTKGTFAGKLTEQFINTQTLYSKMVADLTGNHVDKCDNFCEYYNDRTIVNIRTNLLKEAGIRYESYENGYTNRQGVFIPPLKICDKDIVIAEFGKIGWKVIQRTRKAHIKGLKVNNLLGTNDSDDPTDVGETEQTLKKRRMAATAGIYLLTIILFSFLGVRDIMQWGWTGIILIIFKVIYIFCRAYMSYFDGYNDITVSIVSHINRKCDLLKQFNFWYDINYNIVSNDVAEVEFVNDNKSVIENTSDITKIDDVENSVNN